MRQSQIISYESTHDPVSTHFRSLGRIHLLLGHQKNSEPAHCRSSSKVEIRACPGEELQRARACSWGRVRIYPVECFDFADINSIIFVHGLGSNPDTTWRARRSTNTSHPIEETRPNSEKYVNWVSDFLPSDIPPEVRKDARIFFYNYDSY